MNIFYTETLIFYFGIWGVRYVQFKTILKMLLSELRNVFFSLQTLKNPVCSYVGLT